MKRQLFILSILVSTIVVLTSSIYAAEYDVSYPLNPGDTITIEDVEGNAYTVTNDSTTEKYFIPNKTQAEWNAFKNAADNSSIEVTVVPGEAPPPMTGSPQSFEITWDSNHGGQVTWDLGDIENEDGFELHWEYGDCESTIFAPADSTSASFSDSCICSSNHIFTLRAYQGEVGSRIYSTPLVVASEHPITTSSSMPTDIQFEWIDSTIDSSTVRVWWTNNLLTDREHIFYKVKYEAAVPIIVSGDDSNSGNIDVSVGQTYNFSVQVAYIGQGNCSYSFDGVETTPVAYTHSETPVKRIIATQNNHDGNFEDDDLGQPWWQSADNFCQDDPATASSSGTWKALMWNPQVRTGIIHEGVTYVNYLNEVVFVAASDDDVPRSISHAVDPTKECWTAGKRLVWTGEKALEHCSSWSSISGHGFAGGTGCTNYMWMDGFSCACANIDKGLYCVEQ